MILTRKALEHFIKWHYTDVDWSISYIDGYVSLFDVTIHIINANALIIEWLDSVGIRICVGSYHKEFDKEIIWESDIQSLNTSEVIHPELLGKFQTRQQATESAIKKSNDIFNLRFTDK